MCGNKYMLLGGNIWLLHSKYFYPCYCFLIPQFQNFTNLAVFLITIISNVIVLVSHNCFVLVILCLWAMVSIRRLSPPTPPPNQVFMLYTLPIFCFLLWSMRLLQEIMHFQNNANCSFNLLLVDFEFAVLCICVS